MRFAIVVAAMLFSPDQDVNLTDGQINILCWLIFGLLFMDVVELIKKK